RMSVFGASLTTLSGSSWRLHFRSSGEVAEWFKAAVLKTVEAERLPGVRIPSSPPTFAPAPGEGCPAVAQSAKAGRSNQREQRLASQRRDCVAGNRLPCALYPLSS